LNREQYSNLANELHEAERRREPIEQFSKRFPYMSSEDSYAPEKRLVLERQKKN
jgi:2-keto-4-pentenoate hydratase